MSRPERIERERRGRFAEMVAAWWLRLKGYRILARRMRNPRGEIDIIASRGATVAFVEVKARRTPEAALQGLTARQCRRIAAAAEAWVALQREPDRWTLRFDLIVLSPGRLPCHLQDAWRPEPGATR